MKKTIRKWVAGWVALTISWMAMGIISPGQLNAGTAKTENAASTVNADKSENIENNSFKKEGTTPEIAKKKRFPWLWVATGVVVAGVVVYFTLIKKPKYELTIEVGTGVTGTPAGGKYTYKKGQRITYNFTCADGYKNLSVQVDGENTAESGTIVMDRDHKIKALATKMTDFSLVVKTSDGITGIPAAGTYSYHEGMTVSYHYTVSSGYKELIILLDGQPTTASGSILMNMSHTLDVTVAKLDEYTLVVTMDAGISGSPAAGIYHYEKGKNVPYQYSAAHGIPFVKLDGNPVLPSGSLKMNSNHVLKIVLGQLPDIRGKWRFQLIKSRGIQSNIEYFISFTGTKTSGTPEIIGIVTADPENNLWYLEVGDKGEYHVSSSSLTISIWEQYKDTYVDFSGNFTASNTIKGDYILTWAGDPYDQHGYGTFTAFRIE